MKHGKSIFIIFLFLALMAVLGYTVKIKDISDKDIASYQDSMKHMLYINMMIELENDSLISCNDSLLTLPPKVKTIYREKYIFIEHSDINELDSLVRTEF